MNCLLSDSLLSASAVTRSSHGAIIAKIEADFGSGSKLYNLFEQVLDKMTGQLHSPQSVQLVTGWLIWTRFRVVLISHNYSIFEGRHDSLNKYPDNHAVN
jgi:hypothetical protein